MRDKCIYEILKLWKIACIAKKKDTNDHQLIKIAANYMTKVLKSSMLV